MKQHPVPQNITAYQFRLVGDMTLKQFLELAGGVICAYISFSLKIPGVFKWPLVVFFSLLGIALAFLPIQDRPLDKWLINFIKSVYSSNRYLWQKSNQPPDFLLKKGLKPLPQQAVGTGLQAKKAMVQEYLGTLPQPAASLTTPLDQQESKKLTNINKLLKTPGPQTKAGVVKPPTAMAMPAPTPVVVPTPAMPSQKPPVIQPAPPLTPPMAVDSLFPVKQKIKPEVVAMFSHKLAIPQPPDIPNVIVGMVVNHEERILPNTLIEIQDQKGNTIRALKTNKLGQFFTASPLNTGNYKIQVEHDNYDFDIIKFRAEGKIIPPLKIKAKSKLTS